MTSLSTFAVSATAAVTYRAPKARKTGFRFCRQIAALCGAPAAFASGRQMAPFEDLTVLRSQDVAVATVPGLDGQSGPFALMVRASKPVRLDGWDLLIGHPGTTEAVWFPGDTLRDGKELPAVWQETGQQMAATAWAWAIAQGNRFEAQASPVRAEHLGENFQPGTYPLAPGKWAPIPVNRDDAQPSWVVGIPLTSGPDGFLPLLAARRGVSNPGENPYFVRDTVLHEMVLDLNSTRGEFRAPGPLKVLALANASGCRLLTVRFASLGAEQPQTVQIPVGGLFALAPGIEVGSEVPAGTVLGHDLPRPPMFPLTERKNKLDKSDTDWGAVFAALAADKLLYSLGWLFRRATFDALEGAKDAKLPGLALFPQRLLGPGTADASDCDIFFAAPRWTWNGAGFILPPATTGWGNPAHLWADPAAQHLIYGSGLEVQFRLTTLPGGTDYTVPDVGTVSSRLRREKKVLPRIAGV